MYYYYNITKTYFNFFIKNNSIIHIHVYSQKYDYKLTAIQYYFVGLGLYKNRHFKCAKV